ncbi:MAG: hypothetical protein ABIL11_00295 [Chloroflexota bacterium]
MTANPFPTYDDEIDLRAIIQTLWKARKAILIVTLGLHLWLLPSASGFCPANIRGRD